MSPRQIPNAEKLHALNTPQRIGVQLDNGRPGKVIRGRRDAQSIEMVLECWRIDDEWWRQPISRLCYEVVLQSGGRVIVYQDLITNEWWLQKP